MCKAGGALFALSALKIGMWIWKVTYHYRTTAFFACTPFIVDKNILARV